MMRVLLVSLLSILSNYEVVVVPSLKVAREELGTSTFDIILLDYDLDDGKGDGLLIAISNLTPRPFVVATS